MKTNTEAKKEQTSKTTPTSTPTQNGKAKTPKAKKDPTPKAEPKVEAKADADTEPVDRMPTTVAELKESKSGLVTFLFLSGRDKDEIARELQATFKLAEAQAVKIVRRITGRARFFRRAFDLMAAK
ncbi:MAG TPA: hypothetical protein PKM73_18215 [Verrucomicrobiota bacterium]|nr:hypothetical protein [Verrucomicrobiota bacterium]HNU53129.1 hypothetical protein [Verrucomicrobiota bacterium]